MLRNLLISFALLGSTVTSLDVAAHAGTDKILDKAGMSYHSKGFSPIFGAEQKADVHDQTIADAASQIRSRQPVKSPTTLIYVTNTQNLVDTPAAFSAYMGAQEAPTARIAATRTFRGSALRVVDPTFPTSDMRYDCANKQEPSEVYLLRTYVSNYDKDVIITNKGFAPFADDDANGVDYSRGNTVTADTFTIESELVDCYGNVLRGISPTIEVRAVNRDKSVFLFSKYVGVYKNNSTFVSNSLNSAKKKAIEMVVADMGMYIAGFNEREIEYVMTGGVSHQREMEKAHARLHAIDACQQSSQSAAHCSGLLAEKPVKAKKRRSFGVLSLKGRHGLGRRGARRLA